MKKFQKDAAVHTGTVTRLSQEALEPKRRGPYGPRQREEIDVVQVHPAIWQAALDAADGHANRLEVLSTTEVYIHNDSSWRKRR